MPPPLLSGISIPCQKAPAINLPIARPDAFGERVSCVTKLKADSGKKESISGQQAESGSSFDEYFSLTGEEILEIVKKSNIIDEYTDTTLYEELVNFSNKKINYLFANAVDEDPYISSGARQLLEFPSEITLALSLCKKVCGAKHSKLLLCDRFLLADQIGVYYQGMSVVRLFGRYPLMPSFKRKYRKKGCGLIGVGALRHLASLIMNGRDERLAVLTVSGDCIKNPQNIMAFEGTKISDILNFAGLDKSPEVIFSNGVIAPKIIKDIDGETVSCEMRSITALSSLALPQKMSCLGCGKCVSVCHKKLMPYYIVKAYERGEIEETAQYYPFACDSCGACTISCPASIDVCGIVSQCRDELSASKLRNNRKN